jgi:hypothetical protein
MAAIDEAMRRVVEGQRFGYVATVCPDGTPNLSPKGTVSVWDDDHIAFADIRSPRTVANLKQNPSIEINVVDPLSRKGFRFKGIAKVLEQGPAFESGVAFFRERGVTSPIRSVVVVRVARALAVTSPAYDSGASEDEIRARWTEFYGRPASKSARDVDAIDG